MLRAGLAAVLDDEKGRAASRAVLAGELEHVPRRVAVVIEASGYGASGLVGADGILMIRGCPSGHVPKV